MPWNERAREDKRHTLPLKESKDMIYTPVLYDYRLAFQHQTEKISVNQRSKSTIAVTVSPVES